MASERRVERVCEDCVHYWYRTDPDLDRYCGDGCCDLHDKKCLGHDTCTQWTENRRGKEEAADGK